MIGRTGGQRGKREVIDQEIDAVEVDEADI